MSVYPIIWDADARTRLSGLGATSVMPVTLTQGTRGIYELGRAITASVTRVLTLTEMRAQEPSEALSTRTTSHAAPWQQYIYDRFEQMLLYRGLASEPYPSAVVLDRAWTEALALFGPDTPTPSVVPSEDGGVIFSWHKGGWDVELEVDESETIAWGHSRLTDRRWAGPLDDCRTRLRDALQEMTSD